MKLTKLLLTAVAALGFITATAQTYSKIEIQVDTAKPVWNSIQKALSEQRLSVAERSSDRMLTSYVVWSNMLTQNRGRIAITLIGETLRIEMIDRQYSAGTQWSDAIGDLSKKNHEKYLLPLSARVTELLSQQSAQPAQATLTAQNSGSPSPGASYVVPIQGAPPTFTPTLCNNGICLEILQAKIIGQKLLIKGKMMSQRGNIRLYYGVRELKFTTDAGEEHSIEESCMGKSCTWYAIDYQLINSIPVKNLFITSFQEETIEMIEYFDFSGMIYQNNQESQFSFKITRLPIPFNTDPLHTAKGEVEIMDGVYLIPMGWEKNSTNLKLNIEILNTAKEAKEINLGTYKSRAIDDQGIEYKIKNIVIGSNSSDSNSNTSNTINSGIKLKGYIEIENGATIGVLPLLEIEGENNTFRLRNLKPTLKSQ